MSTPIGNLGDITYRAVEVLRRVDRIVAEDTRHSRTLLDRYEITTPLESYHEHNEASATPRLLARLRDGFDLALISDAGTPLLSDPGSRLVEAAIAEGYDVVPVPGASALLAGLVAAGLATDRFTFFGFLPRKGRARHDVLRALSTLDHTAVLYEAPLRVADTLSEFADEWGGRDRRVAVAREMTKQFEEVRRGTAGELAAYYREAPPRGEVVIVVAGREAEPVDEAALRSRVRELREGGMSPRDVARALMSDEGAPRNLAYRLAHES